MCTTSYCLSTGLEVNRTTEEESKYLCRNNQIILLPSKVLNRLTEHDLRVAGGVVLSRIEEVHACVVRDFDGFECILCNPSAQHCYFGKSTEK